MLKVEFTGQFKKDYRLAVKRGCNPAELQEVIGNYKDMRECHIEPDLLMVYKVFNDMLILRLIRTGTHSDLF